MSIVLAIVTLMMVVVAHELGHSIAAYACGIKTKCLSIGFGPGIAFRVPVIGKLKVSILLLGGYVQLNRAQLKKASILQQELVNVSGMLANVVFAIAIALIEGKTLMVIPVLFLLWLSGPYIILKIIFAEGAIVLVTGGSTISFIQNYGSVDVGFWQLAAVLNMVVAMFNLVPIPPLDGGKLLLDPLERLHFLRIPLRVVSIVAAICILLLTAASLVYDCFRLFC